MDNPEKLPRAVPGPTPTPSAMDMAKEAASAAAECNVNMPPKCRDEGTCIPDANGLSFAESKAADMIAYDGEKGDIYTFPDGKQWKVASVEGGESGFRAVVLKPVDQSDSRIIVSYAGTDFFSLSDWITNIQQGVPPWLVKGLPTPDDYEWAAEIARIYKEQFGDRLILTGHSLGGGMASFAAAMSGCTPSTAINAAPLNQQTLELAILATERCEKNKRNTQHYNTYGEIVHMLDFLVGGGDQFGNGVPYSVPGPSRILESITPMNLFGNHGLSNTAPCVEPPVLAEAGIDRIRKQVSAVKKDQARLEQKKESALKDLAVIRGQKEAERNSIEGMKRELGIRKPFEK